MNNLVLVVVQNNRVNAVAAALERSHPDANVLALSVMAQKLSSQALLAESLFRRKCEAPNVTLFVVYGIWGVADVDSLPVALIHAADRIDLERHEPWAPDGELQPIKYRDGPIADAPKLLRTLDLVVLDVDPSPNSAFVRVAAKLMQVGKDDLGKSILTPLALAQSATCGLIEGLKAERY